MIRVPVGGKVIFLDVDGVLNSAESWGQTNAIEASLVSHLADIVTASGAFIILSSTWRLREDLTKIVIKKCVEKGIPRELFIGSTPDIDFPPQVDPGTGRVDYGLTGVLKRCEEIKHFLRTHGLLSPDKSIKWVVLDDMDMTVDDLLRSHCVVSRRDTGLTEGLVQQAINILSN